MSYIVSDIKHISHEIHNEYTSLIISEMVTEKRKTQLVASKNSFYDCVNRLAWISFIGRRFGIMDTF